MFPVTKPSGTPAGEAQNSRADKATPSGPWDGVHTPANDANLKQQIELVSSRAPRFLFRTWNSRSGGNSKLNSTKAIIPHAFFLDKEMPLSIHDISREHLVGMKRAHFTGVPFPTTAFSSWSSSLAFVLSFSAHYYDTHISIVDTKKLGPSTTVPFTPAMRILDEDPHYANEEFMIYGPVSGRAHAAVSLRELQKNGLPMDRFNYHVQREVDMPTAKRLGVLFGADFALAFTVYALSMQPPTPAKLRSIAHALAKDPELAVPHDWASDATIMSKVVFTGDMPDANALLLLGLLAQQTQEQTESAPATEHEAPEKKRSSSARARSKSRVRKAVASVGTSRMSLEAKKLYVAMIGWEDPVLGERLRPRGRSRPELEE